MRFTKEQKCPHCGGKVTGHTLDTNPKYWCEKCGANSTNKPKIEVQYEVD